MNPPSVKTTAPLRKHDAFAKVCHLTGRAIATYAMIRAEDRLLVGISGGKDSLLLMHVLTRLQQRSPVPFHLHAATVDMGFKSFGRAELAAYCQTHGWSHEFVTLDGRELLTAKGADERPCSLCSRLRRGQLHGVADRMNCNVLVLGQHLDDLCASLLMSLFRGNGLKTMGPNVPADSGSKRLIRPFCEIPESLITEAAAAYHFPPSGRCDYLEELEAHGDRAYLRRLLGQLEEQFPGVRHAMLNSMRDLRPGHLLDKRFLPDLALPTKTEAKEE